MSFFLKKKESPTRMFPSKFCKRIKKTLFRELLRTTASMVSRVYKHRSSNIFKVDQKVNNVLGSLLWNLKMFSFIPVEEEDLYWILSTSSLNFVFQTEQTTVLLWRNSALYLLENSWIFECSHFSELLWILTPVSKNIFRVNNKKLLQLFQLAQNIF